MGQPTVDYLNIKRNGGNLTSPVDTTWGAFTAGSGTFDAEDPTTWDRLLIHPYEDATTYRDACGFNTDTYTIELDCTPNSNRGDFILKRAYGVWDDLNTEYDYTLEDIFDKAWEVDDVLDHQIDIDADDLETTSHTFVGTAVGTEDDYVAPSTPLFDYKPVLVQVMPKVDITAFHTDLTISENLHNTTDDVAKFTAATEGTPTAKDITFSLEHSHCNGSTSTEGTGAWVWYKDTTYKSEDITWLAGDTSTGALTIDGRSSAGTDTYYLELFQFKGLRSGFDTTDTAADDPRNDGLSYDRRIQIDVTFS